MADIYLSSTLMWNASLESIFLAAYENQLDGIELWAQHMCEKSYSPEECRKLSALYPVNLCIHSFSWDLNLASMNEGIRRASVEEVKRAVDFAGRAGAMEVTVHPGRQTILYEKSRYMETLRQSLMEILEYSEQEGVDISLEIMEKLEKELIVSIEDARQVTGDRFPDFYYTLDVAHSDTEEEIFQTLDGPNRISKLHLSNRLGTYLHTPLAKGDYDMKSLLPKLEAYHLPIVIEGFDSDSEFQILKQNIKFLKDYGGRK